MDKVSEAKIFLKSFGMPGKQQSDIAAYTLLTLAHMKPSDHWNDATNDWIRIHDVLQFTGENYGNRDANKVLKRLVLYSGGSLTGK